MPPSVLRRLSRILIAEPRAFLEAIEAQAALFLARMARRNAPLGSLVEESRSHPAYDCRWDEPAGRVSRAVNRVARFGLIRPTCLEQAIALQRMLKRRGVDPGVIRIGVRLREGVLAAHAWVQVGDRILGETSQRVSRFQPLTDVRAIDR